MIACVVFDLLGTLVDPMRIRIHYAHHLGLVMAEQHGGTAHTWTTAYNQVVEDWDSYYIDLDLNGDDGVEHLWEGMFRTTRALFRLTGMAEPTAPELTVLARTLQERVCACFNSFYPGAAAVVYEMYTRGLALGAAGLLTKSHVAGLLRGASISDMFTGPILTPEITGRYARNTAFYAGLSSAAARPPQQILLVSPDSGALHAASSLGYYVVHVTGGDLLPLIVCLR